MDYNSLHHLNDVVLETQFIQWLLSRDQKDKQVAIAYLSLGFDLPKIYCSNLTTSTEHGPS